MLEGELEDVDSDSDAPPLADNSDDEGEEEDTQGRAGQRARLTPATLTPMGSPRSVRGGESSNGFQTLEQFAMLERRNRSQK